MKLFNTLSKSKEDFVPLQEKSVTMYVCGVTVYDECHLGHARAYVCFDVLRRYLEYSGYKVQYIQNFTDIDDKIITRAQEMLADDEGDMKHKVQLLSQRYIDGYFEVMDALGVQRASDYPLATDHIGEMIAMIETLIEKGAAYAVDGDVFYEVSQFENYGALSGKNLEDLRAGQRVDVDSRKKSPFDFVLWKSSKPGEPAWESPWGGGRPGWHIECSAMSLKTFKGTFDIHGGGCDLVFPHHENEIAQSEASTGKTFARYWVHNGFLTINKEKMSKSLGNFFILKDIYKEFAPEVVRMFLLSAHYRSPIDFSDERLKESREQMHRAYVMLRHAQIFLTQCDEDIEPLPDDVLQQIAQKFKEGMDDDCNTAIAIACLFEIVSYANGLLEQDSLMAAQLKFGIELFLEISTVLHLFQNPYRVVSEEGSVEDDLAELLQKKLQARRQARLDKDWALADQLRDEILMQCTDIEIEDTPKGTLVFYRPI